MDPADLPDPAAAHAALSGVGFLVALEVRSSAVTELADVVLPVAPPVEKAGTFLNWEGRPRPFPQVGGPARVRLRWLRWVVAGIDQRMPAE